MYLQRTQVSTRAGTHAKVETIFHQLADRHKGHPEFVMLTVFHALGHPSKYEIHTRWETREAAETYRKSPETAAFQEKNKIASLVTVDAPVQGYTATTLVGDQDEAEVVAIIEWTLRLPAVKPFEVSRDELAKLRQKHAPGFACSELFRWMGDPINQLLLNGYRNIADYDASESHEEIQAFQKDHAASLYTDLNRPSARERYEIIVRG
jgi:heme-degrading monooxygenase HmoA